MQVQAAVWVLGMGTGMSVWGWGHWGIGMGGTKGMWPSATLQMQVLAPASQAAVPAGRAVLPAGACTAASSWTLLMRPH